MTIGYEGLDLEVFFELLQKNRVERLVDVRQMPLSRKKGFSKTALGEAARAHGIQYTHLQQLGCPKTIRTIYKANGDWSQYTDAYQSYLQTQDTVLEELSQLARAERCSLLCFEADPYTCHRLFVAEGVARKSGNRVWVHHLGVAFKALATAA